jgi:hypothetical protein
LSNVIMDGVGKPINISQYFQMQGEAGAAAGPVSTRTPAFRNIAISHVTIRNSAGVTNFGWNPDSISRNPPQPPVTINIEGLPEMPIAGLCITDVIASGKGGVKVHDTTGLDLRNIRMDAEIGPAFQVRDSRELTLDDVSPGKPLPAAQVVRLERCPDAVVRVSRER